MAITVVLIPVNNHAVLLQADLRPIQYKLETSMWDPVQKLLGFCPRVFYIFDECDGSVVVGVNAPRISKDGYAWVEGEALEQLYKGGFGGFLRGAVEECNRETIL